MAVVCPSVCLYVPCLNERAYEAENWREGSPWHGDPWPNLEVERSTVKVTRPLNTVTEYHWYLWNGKAYEFQTWYTVGVYVRFPPSWKFRVVVQDITCRGRWHIVAAALQAVQLVEIWHSLGIDVPTRNRRVSIKKNIKHAEWSTFKWVCEMFIGCQFNGASSLSGTFKYNMTMMMMMITFGTNCSSS